MKIRKWFGFYIRNWWSVQERERRGKKKREEKKKGKNSRINQTWPAALTSWSHSGHPALDILPAIKQLFTSFFHQWAGNLSLNKSLVLLLCLGLHLGWGLGKPQSPEVQGHCNYKGQHSTDPTLLPPRRALWHLLCSGHLGLGKCWFYCSV